MVEGVVEGGMKCRREMAIPEDWMLVLKGWSDRLTALYALLSSIIKER